jgi:membrane protease YdiL (CAAX protease family)
MNTAHLLAGFVALLVVMDQFSISRLKSAPEPRPRLRTYWLIMAGLWLATLWAAAIMGWRALWTVRLPPAVAKWFPGCWAVGAMVVASLLAILLPVALVRKPKAAASIARRLERLRFMLPQSSDERFWWAMLSFTAGICEECIFRSFLLRYLQMGPWHLGLVTALGVACLAFALGHIYQGFVRALGTGVLAILFFVFFLGTGNLLLPMALHALTDLRILLLLPPSGRPTLAGSQGPPEN